MGSSPSCGDSRTRFEEDGDETTHVVRTGDPPGGVGADPHPEAPPSPFTCPECDGALWGSHEDPPIDRCHAGAEALEAAQEFRPEVALLDIGMPKTNGDDVARQIRRQDWGKHVVLMAITGWGQNEDRQRTIEAGFDHHLVKPVDPDLLASLLAEIPAKRHEA